MTRLCALYGVTRGGFYAWRARPASAHAEQDRCLSREIATRFARHGGRYGSPRLHRELVAAGWTVSRRRVARLMRAAGLRARAVQGYRAKTGILRFYGQHPNHLRGTLTTAPDQIWVGDITYLAIAGQWQYLAVVMDHFSRRVLAWRLSRRRDSRVTRAVLDAALRRRAPAAGLIFHSDRGAEYVGAPFGTHLLARGIVQSTTQTGPGDNARMESFFHSLKAEAIRGQTFPTPAALRRQLQHYFAYYNQHRMHSGLGYRSPIAFERAAA